MDNGLLNGVIVLDLKKAFDRVDHQILIRKLSMYGLHGLTLEWLKSYLKNRRQICKVNHVMSKQHVIRCGVPQGSNLSPLISFYINDLPKCLEETKVSMFGDDTNLSTIGKTVKELES